MSLFRRVTLAFVLRFTVAVAYTVFSTSTTSSLPPSTTSSLDFGNCNNPGITFGYDLDGSSQYGFAPTNQTQFPHSWSPDVSNVEHYICERLDNDDCQASAEAVQACYDAFEQYSGLSGQNAADSWNSALGVGGGSPTETTTTTTSIITYAIQTGPTQSIETLTSTAVTTSRTTSMISVSSTSTSKTMTASTHSTVSSISSSKSASTTRTTTTRTTVVTASQTTGAQADNTNGSPFTQQNHASYTRITIGSLFSCTLLGIVILI